LFVTLEGGEGAGKSTQAALLAGALARRGHRVLVTREPGGTPFAEELRRLVLAVNHGELGAMTEAMVHWTARLDHWEHAITPALREGRWVVCDRFADSTLAYQGYGLGVDPARLHALHRLVLADAKPDLTLVFDVPVEVGLARARERGRADRYEAMDTNFHQRLRDGFLAIARAEPDRCIVIDACAAPETVHARVMAALDERGQA
jgi:dTMP kinase